MTTASHGSLEREVEWYRTRIAGYREHIRILNSSTDELIIVNGTARVRANCLDYAVKQLAEYEKELARLEKMNNPAFVAVG